MRVIDKKNDEVLMIVRDEDIFPSSPYESIHTWEDRRVGKVVLFNADGRIALIGNKVNSFFLLPGGGIQTTESIIDGVKRECREETGCEIEIQNALGVTEDFRARERKHCMSYGYSAKVISGGYPALTVKEANIGLYVTWLPLSEAVELFALQEKKVKAGEVHFYNTCFNIVRDSFFLRQARDLEQK